MCGICGYTSWHEYDSRILEDMNRTMYHRESVDGRYVIVYNGKIYSFKRLREGLTEKGYRFGSDCDTEVILNRYIE